jgi:flagellar hook-associated protein 2
MPLNQSVKPGALVLSLETATRVENTQAAPPPKPPVGPAIPPVGGADYGGAIVENDPSKAPLPPWNPPKPKPRVDDMNALSIVYADGTKQKLPPITDSDDFTKREYRLADIDPQGKAIAAIELDNNNTAREISLKKVSIYDPSAHAGFKPANPVSVAQDAILDMDGIEIKRPTNTISDLIPGVTITPKQPSKTPVSLDIEPDRKSIKDAIITLVGNYNHVMAEANVLTRTNDQIIRELTYLDKDEQATYQKMLGTFSGDTTLTTFRDALLRAATAPYPTDKGPMLIGQFGIGTDVRQAGASSGYDPSRLRGYLEIDEGALDAALQNKLPEMKEFFGSDTDRDLIVDTGFAYQMDSVSKPYTGNTGIIALKTGTIDNQVTDSNRRIQSLDEQLADKEADLKVQYGKMEGAYDRMQQMTNSLNNFSKQNSGEK